MLKRLKTLLAGVSLALLMALGVAIGPDAWAAWNLRQNGNGTTDFVPTAPSFSPARVGRTIITHTIADVNTAATHYIMSPITGRLRNVMLVPDNTLASAITLSVFLDQSPATSTFFALAPTGRIAAASATGVGVVIPGFFRRTASGSTLYSDPEWVSYGVTGFTDKAEVKQYRPIVIRLDNGSGTARTGNLVITIDPE